MKNLIIFLSSIVCINAFASDENFFSGNPIISFMQKTFKEAKNYDPLIHKSILLSKEWMCRRHYAVNLDGFSSNNEYDYYKFKYFGEGILRNVSVKSLNNIKFYVFIDGELSGDDSSSKSKNEVVKITKNNELIMETFYSGKGFIEPIFTFLKLLSPFLSEDKIINKLLIKFPQAQSFLGQLTGGLVISYTYCPQIALR